MQDHNKDAEKALLGIILKDPKNTFYACTEILEAGDFGDPLHEQIFSAIGSLINDGKGIEIPLICPMIKANPNGIALKQYLLTLKAQAPDGVHAMDFAEAIAADSARRKLMKIGQDLVKNSSLGLGMPEEAANDAYSKIGKVVARCGSQIESFADAAHRVFEDVKRNASLGRSLGVGSGFVTVDGMIGRFMPQTQNIVSGDTSMGKTAFVSRIMRYNAEKERRPGLIASAEMSVDELIIRELSIDTGIPATKIMLSSMNANEWEILEDAKNRLFGIPLYFMNFPGGKTSAIRAYVQREKQARGVELVMIDHLHMIEPVGKYYNEVEKTSNASRELKAIWKATGTTGFVLCHINRERGREERRPKLSDLKWGSAIEQDADTVMFVHSYLRAHAKKEPLGVNKTETEYQNWKMDLDYYESRTEVSLDKNRMGPAPDMRWLGFDRKLTRFYDLTEAQAKAELPSKIKVGNAGKNYVGGQNVREFRR